MTKKTYYVTTPIYYPSGRLHIGNSYSTLLADALARYKRLMGYDVFFLTGTDEHGQKIQQTAEKNNESPQAYVDRMAEKYKVLWEKLGITNDGFIRTTDEEHIKAVQKIFTTLQEKGDIYLGEYTGWYSVSDEEFFTETQLKEVYRDEDGNVIGGVAPSGHEVELVKEEAYFFKLSKYADRLVEYYESHPGFLVPESRQHEMINNFIKPGLNDLAVTRTSFSWGVPVPGDEKHVIYVWIDALSNYITALGYGLENTENFDKFWPADLHVIGKDISRFHMIYWPAMLMALDIPLPKQIFGHGWIVMKEGKMSKSLGNTIYPETLIERYGLDATRFYLLSQMSQGNDTVFTPEDFVSVVNTELANDLGNLLNRTIAMVNKYLDGVVFDSNAEVRPTEFDQELKAYIEEKVAGYHKEIDDLQIARAVDNLMSIVSRTNKYIDETSPWVLAKDEDKLPELRSVMNHLVESLRIIAHLLRPFMANVPYEMFKQLGLEGEEDRLLQDLAWGQVESCVKVVEKGEPIFPRLDEKEEVEYLQNVMKEQKKAASKGGISVDDPSWKPEEVELKYHETKEVDFDTFVKVELKAAEVIDVEPVEESDKLLRFRLGAGDESHRQVLSGLKEHYTDYKSLVGKKVLLAANLKPRKMMGYISQGMLLTTETADGIRLIFLDQDTPNGDLVS